MLIVATFVIGLAVIRLTGGDLARLNDIRIKRGWLAIAAVVIQVAIISVLPQGWRLGHLLINVGTYAVVGVFVWANRHIPWLWLAGVGTLWNTTAIVANGGVMPASVRALTIAHRVTGTGFANSAAVPHARLQFLGDIIPTPSWLPLHNVASVGDVLILTGALLAIATQTRRHIAAVEVVPVD